ncbi:MULTISPECIES: S-layer homology domain-containing protein [unclassified Fusibacter]|uniref:S-layer homology domain-containing protein n=1 Tax=unclassified Fusibacter TaxID=2624464 RepID=UPI0010129EC7|nr:MULTISPECIES: S-layer homology domain-containing protein [unclassified Fusibacter]MCK8060365.1 S-layer homology domain-containing protein [Fusibacter sp. A2]NPE20346.1 hypothetical protein [Fusibacter sp. A1]RXV63552.1 hypothetical protein DWB64_00840 [Fusibacter sp. A1]
MTKKRNQLIMIALILSITIAYADDFLDVKSGAWYYSAVTNLASAGTISGYPDKTYRPQNTVSQAEALVLLMKASGPSVVEEYPGTHWADPYVHGVVEDNIITRNGFEHDKPVDRMTVAEWIVLLYDIQNSTESGTYFEDVLSSPLNTLYEEGIINGVLIGGKRYFKPDAYLTRAELAVIIDRLSRLEIMKLETKVNAWESITIQLKKNPVTEADFEDYFRYMMRKGEFDHTIDYDLSGQLIGLNELSGILSSAYQNVMTKYPQDGAYYSNITFSISTTVNQPSYVRKLGITLLPMKGYTKEDVLAMKKETTQRVESILSELYLSNQLDENLQDYEKAKVIYDWIIKNNEYDLSNKMISHTAYAGIHYHKIVCQGYSALYNYMLEKLGIEAISVAGKIKNSGVDHSWNQVTLDGRTFYVDVTFGDPVPNRPDQVDDTYFDITEEALRKTHLF